LLHREQSISRICIPIFTLIYAAIAAVFGIGALCLLGLAALQLWEAVGPGSSATLADRATTTIESIALITVDRKPGRCR
jgi:hypothetical protein